MMDSKVLALAEIHFDYVNWRKEFSKRRARPISIRYGTSGWHKNPGWLMLALDLEKNEEREFAIADMSNVTPDAILSLHPSGFSAGAEAMREACSEVAQYGVDRAARDYPVDVSTFAKQMAAEIRDVISALPLPSETQSGETARAWELSDETKTRIQEIDDNRRNAAINASNIVAGSIPSGYGEFTPVTVRASTVTPSAGDGEPAIHAFLRLTRCEITKSSCGEYSVERYFGGVLLSQALAEKLAVAATHPQPAPEVREALGSACDLLQKFLDTFGDLGGDHVTQANIDDWQTLSTKGAQS